ncbi:hypothetical protein [Methylorubrum populi]|uniref:hypothetical protein n=1 Tax=Methylorubrum populi TaxID=223967 RepID=UPI003F65D216
MSSARPVVRFGVLVGLVLAAASPAAARTSWVSGTYVYADLCTMPEDGAQTGRRITLKRWPKGDNLVYEGAGLPAPIETAVTVDDTTKDVAFHVETSAGGVSFRGTAGPDALIGTLHSADGSQPLRLKRVLRARAQDTCPGETTGSVR